MPTTFPSLPVVPESWITLITQLGVLVTGLIALYTLVYGSLKSKAQAKTLNLHTQAIADMAADGTVTTQTPATNAVQQLAAANIATNTAVNTAASTTVNTTVPPPNK